MHYGTDVVQFMEKCAAADDFPALLEFALPELYKYKETGCEIVCGPISTGGRGVEANMEIFSATIRTLLADGQPIFSQAPYEERIFFFRKRWQESDPANAGKYYERILHDFYLPLFETRIIRRGWFLPGWKSSRGATWERGKLREFGAECTDLDEKWVDRMLAA